MKIDSEYNLSICFTRWTWL